jgi:hypothetical protein
VKLQLRRCAVVDISSDGRSGYGTPHRVAIPCVPLTRSLSALAAAMLLPIAAAAETSGGLRLSAGGGFDSNARRDYESVGAQADGFAFITGSGNLLLDSERARAAAAYELGLRQFLMATSANVIAQAATAQGLLQLGPSWAVGLAGRGKDRRGGDRDYSDLAANTFVEWAVTRALDLRAEAGPRRFIYRPFFEYSFKASEFAAEARYRFDRRHSISLLGELGLRFYNGDARADPALDPPPSPLQRRDLAFLGGLSYRYRGPVALSLSYHYGRADSNSFGETNVRHRLMASAGMRVFWELTVLAQAAIQVIHYPEGKSSSPELLLLEDDNQDSISLKLLRPLSSHLDAELFFAFYHANLPQNGLTYLRQVAWIGIAWRL